MKLGRQRCAEIENFMITNCLNYSMFWWRYFNFTFGVIRVP